MWYVVCFIITCILSKLFLPAPFNTAKEVLITGIIVLVCLLLFRIIKYLVFILKFKWTIKKRGWIVTKFCVSPFSSKFHGRYSMMLKKNEKIMNVVFIVKKRKYSHYYFENINCLRFYSYNRVMLYKGNRAGTTGSWVSSTNNIQRKDFGIQKIVWPDVFQEEHTLNFILFDKWPNRISDEFTSRENFDLGPGDSICKSCIKIMDWKKMCEVINEI